MAVYFMLNGISVLNSPHVVNVQLAEVGVIKSECHMVWTGVSSMRCLTIRKETGLPARQDPVQLLSKPPVAWVSKQVVITSFSIQMLDI